MHANEKRARALLAKEHRQDQRRAKAIRIGHKSVSRDDHLAVCAIIAALTPQWQLIEFNDDGEPTNVPADTPIFVPPTKRLGMTVAKWNPLDGWETETTSGWIGIYRPTHWMPLPSEPEVP